MNASHTTQSIRTGYLADLAVGRQLRAEAVRTDAVWLFNLPRRLMCRILQRLERRTSSAAAATRCA